MFSKDHFHLVGIHFQTYTDYASRALGLIEGVEKVISSVTSASMKEVLLKLLI